ncbi:MAG: hydrogenase maturation nickel metallochaperone HypA [Thermoanaerobaculia bacterium]|nr:hydrogenase maturation nickel metallochaperone HypA [Thermoanaerobaculia bacterium]
MNARHEYSLVSALLDRVEAAAREHRATAVTAVRVRVGELAGVELPLLATAYELARAGTLCAAAPLELVAEPARWECSACGAGLAREGPRRCAACGGPARLAAGDEMLLERVEMEVPDV